MDLSNDHHEYCTGGFNPDDIVISGISGRFPDCSNVQEFKEAIQSKKNIITFNDIRYPKGIFRNCESSSAVIPDIEKLDADFFRMDRETINSFSPAVRVHLEVAYEAIADSGYDPADLQNRIVGIYAAVTQHDSLLVKVVNNEDPNVHDGRNMVANRTSFALGFIGPSYSIDSACSSSSVALHCAYHDLEAGNVDFAIVSGNQMNFSPEQTHAYQKMGITTPNQQSIPFDESSNGMVRAEATAALFLQKAGTARRVYASIMASKYYSSGIVTEGISVPSGKMQVKIGNEVLKDAGLEPEDVEYMEAHGTGTVVGDPVELNSTAEIFLRNRNRTEPFYIGTIKSAVGHTEATSGICGILNAIFAFETGMISPNHRFKVPNPRCEELVNGSLVVPTELTPLRKRYIPVNSFGLGGTLTSTVLKGNPISYGKKKTTDLPRLVLFPATTEAGVNHVFDYVKENYGNLRDEFYALLSKLSFTPPCSKPVRGYSLLKDPQNPVTHIKRTTPNKRPIWFVMTGMGCQWPGMGLQLMCIDVFAESMRKSATILKKVGIDLFELLRADKNYLQINRRILPAFVTITSIQIALVDLMAHIGITPDNIVGHGTGEIVCAYADGCCNAEETILTAYCLGKAVEDLETKLPNGGMATVGLSWEKALKTCPKGIFPVCNNAADSVTISGLKEPLEKFVAELQRQKISACVVDAYGYGFHCAHIHQVAAPLKELLKKVMKNPKPRTERWLSTSYPESEWDNPESKMANPEYFVHNLMNPVCFYDMVKKIPSDAITIEFGPHFLLQSLLKRCIGSEAAYIGLMNRENEDNVQFFFDAMGKLYTEGADPKIERLYPPVKFPVPCTTPSISNLIQWDHSESYYVPQYIPRCGPHRLEINTDKADAYLLDHFIDGRALFPATGYIYLAWETLATRMLIPMAECPVVIQNFKIFRATVLPDSGITRLYCSIVNGTGYFEISDEKNLVSSGNIFDGRNMVFYEEEPTYECDHDSSISGRDLYNELKMNGYEYGPNFQGLLEVNMAGTNALVLWNNRWIPFLDALVLLFGVLEFGGEFVLPTGLWSIKIDPMVFQKYLDKQCGDGDEKSKLDAGNESEKSQPKDTIPVSRNSDTRTVRAPGVELQKLIVDPANLRGKMDSPTTELYKFIPYNSHYIPDEDIQQQLNYYIGSCNKVIDDIGRVLGKNVSQAKFPCGEVDESAIEDFLGDLSEDHKLLRVLSDISNGVADISTKKEEWLSLYLDSIGMEVLNNVMVNDESLTIMLELMIENTFKKMSMLEVNNNSPLIAPFLLDIISKIAPMKFKQTNLVLSKEREVDNEILSKHSIQLLSQADLSGFTTPDKQQDLVVSSIMRGTKPELERAVGELHSVLKPNGFILLFHKGRVFSAEKFLFQMCGAELEVQPQSVLEEVLQSRNLVTISKISDPFGGAVYLVRPAAPDEGDKIIPVSENSYNWVEDIKKELYGAEVSHRVWVTSFDSPTSGVVGMVNCLKQEPKGERVRCVLISQNKMGEKLPAFSFEEPIYKELRDRNVVMNVWCDGAWGSFRHVAMKKHEILRGTEHAYINCKKYGDLSSFQWIESPLKYVEMKSGFEVQIYYSALNFKDVMLATGKISEAMGKFKTDENDGINDCILGFEFSGRDRSGTRVCGFAKSGGMATSTLVRKSQVLAVPDHWTLEEAATVPTVYGTCIYALIMRARLLKGESILIHSAAGGIGLAAIRIALSLNCEIFATVGTDEKIEYLHKNFPQINPENIGCSRNLTFEKMVMTRTNGRGVDVVLNSLADDKFLASVRCVASGGRYVEIGKYDLAMDTRIGTKMFLNDISFHGVFLDVVFGNKPDQVRKMNEIMVTMADLVKKGVVQPLDRKVFEKDQVEDAFRYMAKGVHIGKVLLKIRDEEPNKLAIPKSLDQLAVPTTYFYRNKVYIIIGGLGGFGIEIAKWMVKKGARYIVLTSRYGARTPYHHLCLQRWKKEGIDVRVFTLNVGLRDEAEKLIREVSCIKPIGGFFNSAVVLKDAFLESQTPETFQEVCESKAAATKYLDEFSRKLCPELDYFVCFSSISCGRGNAGQTNYGFANSVMERVCEQRRREGLHGLAIQWGIIGQVGVVHRHMGDDAKIAGIIAQTVKSCVRVLDIFLQQDGPVVSSYTTSTEKKKSAKGDIMSQIAKILGANDISEISTTRSFVDMGFDSMIGVELKQLIESYCDVSLSMQEIQELKIDDVKAMVAKADSEKTATAAAPSLIATTHINLPVPLLRKGPLQVLNEGNKGKPMFILNIGDEDIEGLKTLAKTFDCTVQAVLWTKETPTSDIKAVASYFHDVIRKAAPGTFNLVSNSISANVALEMAVQSEKSDKRLNSMTLLHGSDDLVNAMNKDDVKAKDSDVGIICQFLEQFLPGGAPMLEEELLKHTNIDQRINAVINYITSSSSQAVNRSEVSISINDFIKKRNIAQFYSTDTKVTMDLNLIEDPTKVLPNDIAVIKEAFEKVASGKVQVHRVCSYQQLSNAEDAKSVAEIMTSYM